MNRDSERLLDALELAVGAFIPSSGQPELRERYLKARGQLVEHIERLERNTYTPAPGRRWSTEEIELDAKLWRSNGDPEGLAPVKAVLAVAERIEELSAAIKGLVESHWPAPRSPVVGLPAIDGSLPRPPRPPRPDDPC